PPRGVAHSRRVRGGGAGRRLVRGAHVTSELFAAGLNHKSAPVELRERLAVPDDDHARILEALRAAIGLDEIMLLSTCNRVEVYAVAPTRAFDGDAVLRALAQLMGVESESLAGHVF